MIITRIAFKRKIFYLILLYTFIIILGIEFLGRWLISEHKVGISKTPVYSLQLLSRAGNPLEVRKGNIKMVLDPHTGIRFFPNQHEHDFFNINRLGYRGAEFKLMPDPKVYRIFVTGGSAAFGIGASNDKNTIPLMLNDLLNKDEELKRKLNIEKFEVINAGIIGFTSIQECTQFVTELIDYRPNAIIMYNGWNDFFVHLNMLASHLEDPRRFIYPGMFRFVEAILPDAIASHFSISFNLKMLLKNLFWRSVVLKRIMPGILDPEFRICKGDKLALNSLEYKISNSVSDVKLENFDKVVFKYVRNLELMINLCKMENILPIVIFQPDIYLLDDLSLEKDAVDRVNSAYQYWNKEVVSRFYLELGKRASIEVEKKGLPFIFAHKALKNATKPCFVDNCHNNDYGYNLISNYIHNKISMENLFLPLSSN